MTDHDDSAPVVLQEPKRESYPKAPPEVDGFWQRYLAPDETILWQGQAQPNAIAVLANLFRAGPLTLILAGLQTLFAGRANALAKATRYLLTGRACYIAHTTSDGATEVAAYPITPTMRLGLGGRSVSFATRPGNDGQPEPIGFHDIPESEVVFALIRDIQRAMQ